MDLSMWSLLNAAGLEENSVPPIVPEVTDPATVKNIIEETELHEMEVENIKLKQDFVELTDMSEKLEDKVEKLGGVIQGTEALLDGVWNPEAFSHFYNRGLKIAASITGKEELPVLGAESLSDSGTAKLAARQGMEGIVGAVAEGIKKILSMIWEAIKRFGAWIKNRVVGVEAAKKKIKALKDAFASLGAKKYKGEINLTYKEDGYINLISGRPELEKIPEGFGPVAKRIDELYTSIVSSRTDADLSKVFPVYEKLISEIISKKGCFHIKTAQGTFTTTRDGNGALITANYGEKTVSNVPELLTALRQLDLHGTKPRTAPGSDESFETRRVNCTAQQVSDMLETASQNLQAAKPFTDKVGSLTTASKKLDGLTVGDVKQEHHDIVRCAMQVCRVYTVYLQSIIDGAVHSTEAATSVAKKIHALKEDK